MSTGPADQTEFIVIGISLIITALCGYLGYLEYQENNDLQKELTKDTKNLKRLEDEIEAFHQKLVKISSTLGWKSRHVQASTAETDAPKRLEGYPSIESLENDEQLIEQTRKIMKKQGYPDKQIKLQTSNELRARQFLSEFYRSKIGRTETALSDETTIARDLNHSHAIVPVIDHTPVSTGTLSQHKQNEKKWEFTEADNEIVRFTNSSSSPGTTLTELLTELTRIRNELNSEVDGLRSEIDQTRQTFYSYVADFGNEAQIPSYLSESRQEISDLEQQVEELTSSVQNKQEQLVSAQGDSDQKLYQKRLEKSQLLDQQNRKLIQKKQQITKLEKRLKDLKDSRSTEKQTDKDAVDGQVLSANQNASVAFIDIGRADGLFIGREFEVFHTLKGGREVIKGRIKVVKLLDKYARAKIISEKNPRNNPIQSSDYVRSEKFTPGQSKSFAFAGTFAGDYNKTVLQQMVRENGHQVKQEVTVNTNYLVIGKGYKNSPAFKKAEELNVNTISPDNLRHMFNKE